MKLQSAGRTDKGKVRTRNEDAILDRPNVGLWAVADGLGGHAAGDYASRLIVKHLAALPRVGSVFDFIESIEDALTEVNADLRRVARERDEDIIASTVVLLVYGDACMFCGWVGDSRAYCLEDGKLVQITRDHVYWTEDEITWFGDTASPVPAGSAPLTRAVGVEQSVFVDWVVAGNRPGTQYVLCSDGLNKEMTDSEIADVCRRYASPRAVLGALFETALSRAARDNVSAVILRLPNHKAPRKPAKQTLGMDTQREALDNRWRAINQPLHVLNEAYRLGEIDREGYRSRRRDLVATVRRGDEALPAKTRWWSRLFRHR